jgi:hypothetical protein
MAESAYLRGLAIRDSDVSDVPRHSLIVRITHWITALSFLGLLLSGVAILLAHPRLYWGETGAVGTVPDACCKRSPMGKPSSSSGRPGE